jgi:inorganic pyrophosphatase
MVDEHGRDDKILCVPTADPHFEAINDLTQLPDHQLKEIEHFFRTYKDLENKHCRTFGWGDPEVALGIVRECLL